MVWLLRLGLRTKTGPHSENKIGWKYENHGELFTGEGARHTIYRCNSSRNQTIAKRILLPVDRNSFFRVKSMNLDCFIAQYSSDENQSQIAFAPNSEVGAKLFDQNAQHRRSVAKLIIESPTLASDPLIRDLYDAETQYSKASFSVYHEFVSMLAKELLTRGGEKNLSCFLHCVMRAQDSYFSSVSVTLDRSTAASVVAFIDSQISKLGENSPKHYAMVRANIERQIGE